MKFRARSVDFLEITNPRALLEVTLRNFTCLTVGDTIKINHVGKAFEFDVREVQPEGAASIIETDCMVDFEEPLGYKESKYAQHEKKIAADAVSAPSAPRTLQKARVEIPDNSPTTVFKPFAGTAKRIDGKMAPSSQDSKSSTDVKPNTEIPAPIPSSEQITYQSTIGDKYSKKKIGVAAFAGNARKLNG